MTYIIFFVYHNYCDITVIFKEQDSENLTKLCILYVNYLYTNIQRKVIFDGWSVWNKNFRIRTSTGLLCQPAGVETYTTVNSLQHEIRERGGETR